MVKFKNDNNREYISYAFKEFLVKTRIKYETNTPSYYPKQNDKVIQQDNKSIIKNVRNMLHSQKFNFNIWAKAIKTIIHVLNKTRCMTLEGKQSK